MANDKHKMLRIAYNQYSIKFIENVSDLKQLSN